MISYAIVQASGRQFWLEENRFYDFDKLPLHAGDSFKLNKILLVNKLGDVQIGKPFLEDSYFIEAKVIRHVSGQKTRVYKMRSKKKTRKTFGSKTSLTRVFITSITSTKAPVSKTLCYL